MATKRKKPARAKKPLRLEWRSPAELEEHPSNWRTHGEAQLKSLEEAIAEVGWAGAVLLNERTSKILDGHARKKVAIESGVKQVPVLIGKWTEEQEKLILSTFDPIGAEAGIDRTRLDALLGQVQTAKPGIQGLLDKLRQKKSAGRQVTFTAKSPEIKEQFNIVIECETEAEQAELLERLTAEGVTCRSLIS